VTVAAESGGVRRRSRGRGYWTDVGLERRTDTRAGAIRYRPILRFGVPLDIPLGHHRVQTAGLASMSDTPNCAKRGRYSSPRQTVAVVRLLRGEDLDLVSRERGVTAATLSGWRDDFLAGGQAALKGRPTEYLTVAHGRPVGLRRSCDASPAIVGT
jgi:hypothetical protein